jgi:hypothetical protein
VSVMRGALSEIPNAQSHDEKNQSNNQHSIKQPIHSPLWLKSQKVNPYIISTLRLI